VASNPNKHRSKRDFLNAFADLGFVPPDNWTYEAIARAEAQRVRKNAFIAAVAAEIPRRLGEHADSFDLAGDRYLSKGIAHIYYTLWRRLTAAKNAPLRAEDMTEEELQVLYPPADWDLLKTRAAAHDEARRLGRTVIWEAWWNELHPRLLARRRAIATFALKQDLLSWGYRVVSGITSEIDWVETKFEHYQLRYVFLPDEGTPEEAA
jgi:hypothetical protein